MAERLADGGELAVDELRRKARRRLVGAIVLALAAAIVVPMLLENEPRPLGDDVSIRIPPRDEGRFVNRLTDAARDSKSAPKVADASGAPAPTAAAPSASPPAAATTKSLTDAEQRVLAPPKSAAKAAPTATEAKPDAAPTTAAAPATPDAAAAKAAGTSDAKPPAPAASVAAASSAPDSTTPASGFVVQLAAFADDKGANALANKLKRANYAAYVEPVTTSRGTLWRVRVGGYASRADADAARVKLKDEGYSGIVASAK